MSQTEATGSSGLIQPIKKHEIYNGSFALDSSKTLKDTTRDPDIPIKCNTFIIIQNDATDLKFAVNRTMFDSPIPVSQSPIDNLLRVRGNINEGIWFSYTGVAGGKLNYIYGNDIEIAQSNKTINTLTIATNSLRYGRDVQPLWQGTAEVSAAGGAPVTLIDITVTAGKVGLFYGLSLDWQETVELLLQWTHSAGAKQRRFSLSGVGNLYLTDVQAMNEGLSADASTHIKVVSEGNPTAGKKFQGDLLYIEV